MNGDESISHRTGGFRQPASMAPLIVALTSARISVLRVGVNPISRIVTIATSKVTPRIPALTMYGTARLVAWARYPPATVPTSIAPPPTTCARANTDSSGPVYPLALSASTNHASVAPEKKVNPRPRRIEAIAQPQSGAWVSHIRRYKRVETNRVPAPNRYESRRPRVSAMMPVGISKRKVPAVKKALAAKA